MSVIFTKPVVGRNLEGSNASDVNNDSTVSGVTVKDALETLDFDIDSRIISNPLSGEYRITNIRLDANLEIIITYDDVPEP